MNRRTIAAIVTALLLSAACTGDGGDGPRAPGGTSVGATTQPKRPNVLVLITDDQRADMVGPWVRETFGQAGTTFENAYATTPLCCPSRASIFTGRYAHNHEVIYNGRGAALNIDEDTTVQRYLDDAGYRTAIFGKYLNEWPLEDPPAHFDEYAVFPGGKELGYYGGEWNVNGKIETIDQYSTHYIAEHAHHFLDESEGRDRRPWLMFLTVYAPHPPYIAEPKYEDATVEAWEPSEAVTELSRPGKPAFVGDSDATEEGRAIREKQARTLLSIDDLSRDLFVQLESLDEADDTLAIYLSDNGYMQGEFGLTKKATPYLPATRIPLMARWPGHIDEDAVSQAIASNIDVAPTIYEATGVDPSDSALPDGRSLLGDVDDRDHLLLEYWPNERETYPGWASVIYADSQYVEYYTTDVDDQETVTFREYYDLRGDENQLENLLAPEFQDAEIPVDKLSALVAEDRVCRGDTCP